MFLSAWPYNPGQAGSSAPVSGVPPCSCTELLSKRPFERIPYVGAALARVFVLLGFFFLQHLLESSTGY